MLVIPFLGIGQINFFNSYGGPGNDYGKSIITTIDSSYTFVGATESFGNGNSDVYLVKIDSLGDFLWSKTYGGANVDWGTDLQQTTDSGYVICGYSNSNNFDYDVFLIKTDTEGDTMWTKHIGGDDWDFGYAIEISRDSNYIIAGETYSFGAGNTDGYVISVDPNGDTLWTQSYGGSDKDRFTDVTKTSSNDLLFSGYKTSTDGDKDFWVVKTDSVGNELWEYVAGDSLNDEANKIIEGGDGNYYFAGTKGSITGTNKDIVIHKLTSAGVFVEEYIFNNANDEEGHFIVQYSGEQNFFTGGTTDSYGNGGQDVYYAEIGVLGLVYDGNIDLRGTAYNDLTQEADTTFDHGLVMVGTTEGTANGISSVFVLKVDSTFASPTLLSETVDITDIEKQEDPYSDAYLFPNPAKDIITISNLNTQKSNSYVIFNILGQPVASGKLNDDSIDIANFPKGHYQLVIKDINKSFSFVKL